MPIRPDEFIHKGVLVEKVGAFVVHIHFSDPAVGTPSAGLHIVKDISLIHQPFFCDSVMEEGVRFT